MLWEIKNGKMAGFRCRVGHAYTMATLAEDQTDGVEEALWAAMRALEEKAALAVRISESTHDPRSRQRLQEQAQADQKHAATIRKIIFEDGKAVESVA